MGLFTNDIPIKELTQDSPSLPRFISTVTGYIKVSSIVAIDYGGEQNRTKVTTETGMIRVIMKPMSEIVKLLNDL